MLKVLCRCYFFFIVNAMIANPRQNANDLDILLEEENGPEKLRIMDINKRFNLDIEERREGIRMKRQVLEECPKGRQQDTVEITCPPETYRQLAEYKCCIYCPEHETGIDCEPYNCTSLHNCSSVPWPPRRIDLDLSKNSIGVLSNYAFNELSELTHLHLSSNKITILPNYVFNRLNNLIYLDLSFNNIIVLQNNVFNGLSQLTRLHLHNNNIKILQNNAFHGMSYLTILTLHSNYITLLTNNLFLGLSKVSLLSLSDNDIALLPVNMFRGLSKLTELYLHTNHISVLPNNIFHELCNLTRLTLYNNNIAILPNNVFHGLSELVILYLSFNNIAIIPINVFGGLSKLTELYLGVNNITTLPQKIFFGLSQLTKLTLHDNYITDVHFTAFKGLYELKQLHMFSNRIAVLPNNVFSEIIITDDNHSIQNNKSSLQTIMPFKLQQLDLANNLLTHLPYLPNSLTELNVIGNKLKVVENMFNGLVNLRMIYTDVPFMCCVKPISVDDNNCIDTHLPMWVCLQNPDLCNSKGDAISSCFDLVSSVVLRTFLWIIGICALIGNMVAMFYRLFFDRDNLTTRYSLFSLNLAISDLLMGIYLITIGVVDAYYNGIYAWNDQKWRNSILCTTAGVLSSVSSEMSIFLILIVTLDRLIVIVFPLSRLARLIISTKQALIASLLLWIVSITLAIIPIAFAQSYFKGEFYSQSSVCLALPLTGDQRPGTEYSFAVFVCLNGIIFLIILANQICICKSLRRSGRSIASSQTRQREITVAITLFFVVMTDFCCWGPIGAMGIASRYGVKIPDGVYAWVMVFVLPVNAAINPFLYTATAVWRRRRQVQTPMTSQIPLQSRPDIARD
ncbi:G-protein coupled receptor GRL101-like isoform X1 [Pecten maximus]|uniref:G-protein coupled receptor GRL101-like isoform X1 n=1 Tax=Pecten maximus TaxID=6579 RepID=UPI00145803C9|nr:G-protein coupled receptor GRL101-like isoform X1 [Pecten maximus]